jgi:hypothetical protein
MSGFCRPSAVGPILENVEMFDVRSVPENV